MNHVSISPTDGNGLKQGLLYLLSYKVRREQAVGSEDVKVTAMNMYKYKEGLRFCKVGRVALIFEQVQFPPWSEFFSVLVWAHFHQ